ncbi:heme-binding protein 2 [Stigmatopora nigra]
MIFLPVLAVLALAGGAEGSVGPSTNGSFCTESKECLEFQLLCKTDEYEVRHYSPTRWVSTDAEAYFMGVGAAMAFRRLFQYITGANEAGVQMEMTAPVLVKIPEETKMWEPAVYTLNFPLPRAYQEKAPAPTNDKLYFTEMPEMDVYVRGYGGWMLSVTSRLHAHLLTKELERVRAAYNRTYHYGVGYDSPLKLLNRHNEVWYIAEGAPVCSDPQEPTPAHLARATNPPTDVPTDQTTSNVSETTAITTPASATTPISATTSAPTTTPASTTTPVTSFTPSSASTEVPAATPPNATSPEPRGNSTDPISASQDGV